MCQKQKSIPNTTTVSISHTHCAFTNTKSATTFEHHAFRGSMKVKGEQAQRLELRPTWGKLVSKSCVPLFVWFAYCLLSDLPSLYTKKCVIVLQLNRLVLIKLYKYLYSVSKDPQELTHIFILVSITTFKRGITITVVIYFFPHRLERKRC